MKLSESSSHYFPADSRAYLRQEFNRRKKRRPHYSLRAFARDLDMSPSSLSAFFAGRQGMSRERVVSIGKKLNLSDEQIAHFCDLVVAEHSRHISEKSASRVRASLRSQEHSNHLSVDKFRLIADWYHWPLLALLGVDSCWSFSEISAALGISVEMAKDGLERLEKLGLIRKEPGRECYKVMSDCQVSGNEGTQRAVQNSHRQYLEMQAMATQTKSIEERESLSVSLAIQQSDWPQVRAELKDAIMDILGRYSQKSDIDQVICASFQAITFLPAGTKKILEEEK